jgi:8-amino-7-oxononanoate synthase
MKSPWIDALLTANLDLMDQDLIRHLKMRSSPNAAYMIVNGANLLSFSSNDYLGLSHHPHLIEAMADGAKLYGVGSGASSLISGHTIAHQLLEDHLAQTQSKHIPDTGACFINSGFMANIAMLTALATLGEVSIYSDSLNHASLIDGIRMAKVQSNAQVFIYPHGDLNILKTLLQADKSLYKLIVTDAVFSMDGDIADLASLSEIAEQHHALLYIDDAHGFGVFGDLGHGLLEYFDICSSNIIYMATLGKAVGVSGAFIAASQCWIDWLIQKARPVIYSTAPSPAIAHTILKSIEFIESNEGKDRREHLQELIRHWNNHAQFKRWVALPSKSAIQPLIIGSNRDVITLSSALHDLGYWVPAIRPPTVPKDMGRLRISLNAEHTIAHLDELLQTLLDLERIDYA